LNCQWGEAAITGDIGANKQIKFALLSSRESACVILAFASEDAAMISIALNIIVIGVIVTALVIYAHYGMSRT
jgi:hypothetical protein